MRKIVLTFLAVLLMFSALPLHASDTRQALGDSIREFDLASYRTYAAVEGMNKETFDAASAAVTPAYGGQDDLDVDEEENPILWITIGAGIFALGALLIVAFGA